ncbi:MAG: SPFH domain-containing protein [Sandaracinaceae bacterium]
MAYRDDLEAAHARADALEERLQALEAENAALRDGDARTRSARLEHLEAENAELRSEAAVTEAALEDAQRPAPRPPEHVPAYRRREFTLGGTALGFAFVGAMSLYGGFRHQGFVFLGLACLVGIVAAIRYATGRRAQPGFLLVVFRRRPKSSDASGVNYRVVSEGAVTPIPLLERIDALDLRPHELHVAVAASTQEREPVDVYADARIRLADVAPGVDAAIERFLGRRRHEVERRAKEALVHQIRGFVGSEPSSALRADLKRARHEIRQRVEDELGPLGIVVERVKVDIVKSR